MPKKRSLKLPVRYAEYRQKLYEAFGENTFLPVEGARVLGLSTRSSTMCEMFERLVRNGSVYRANEYFRGKVYRAVYCCVPIKESDNMIPISPGTDPEEGKVLLGEQRRKKLRKVFGNDPFTAREAAKVLNLSVDNAKSFLGACRRKKLLRRGEQTYLESGKRVVYAFLTAEQIRSGNNYDWTEAEIDDGPTNGVITLDVQLFGDFRKRYEEVRAQKLANYTSTVF